MCQECGGVATLSKTAKRYDILLRGVVPTDGISKTDSPHVIIPCGRQKHLSRNSRNCSGGHPSRQRSSDILWVVSPCGRQTHLSRNSRNCSDGRPSKQQSGSMVVVSPMDVMWMAVWLSNEWLSPGDVCRECGGVTTLSKTDKRCDIL